MSEPQIPNMGDLSPFEEMPDVPERCAECPAAAAAVERAMAARGIAQTFLEIVAQRPGEDVIAERLEEMPETVEMLRSFLTLIADYRPEDVETAEQITAIMNKEQGEMTNRFIDQANEGTLHLRRLLDNCVVGMTSTTIPRPNRRPARLTYCDGTVNSAGYLQPVETEVRVEEID